MFRRIFSHSAMLCDKVRMVAYQKAIHEVVKKGDIVADIGTGSGIMAFFALQAGASKVYAIGQSDIILEAEKLAQINKLADKITFIRGLSDQLEIPEKVERYC